MNTQPFDDPFLRLGIASDADDDAVRAAYHQRVRAGTADAQVNAAYASIRTAADRDRLRFTALTTCIAQLPAVTVAAGPLLAADQREALVRECASLSDWELGHD